MRVLIVSAVSAILAGSLAYIAGGYFTAKRLARDTNYAQLMWLTSIDRDLQNGRMDRARKTALFATDGTLTFLGSLDGQPLPILIAVLGGIDRRKYNEMAATRAKQHFLPLSREFSRESVMFLEGIKEVEIPPSSCASKKEPQS